MSQAPAERPQTAPQTRQPQQPARGETRPTLKDVTPKLAAVFQVNEVRWKPQSVKGNRALAIAYVDCRTIQDRLDEVIGVENWMDDYEILIDGSVMCRLKIFLGGKWVIKTDVGSPSEQPDSGDRLKAAFSDALKRAAVKFGVGRYLYRLPAVWCDYDPVKKQFTGQPQLPAWARPGPRTTDHAGRDVEPEQPKKEPLPPPKDGKELVDRLVSFEAAMVKEGKCKPRELISHVEEACHKAGYAKNLLILSPHGVAFAVEVIKEYAKRATTTPAGANVPNGASLTVREAALRELRAQMGRLQKEFNEEPDRYLDRVVHNRLTMADLESRPDLWSVEAISQITEGVDQYVSSGVPY